MADTLPHQLVLTVACPSAAGQVAAVVGFLDRHQCYVDELTVFDDDLSQRFFVRCVFHGVDRDETLEIAALKNEFTEIADRFSMTWAMHNVDARPKVLIMVSKLEHCLADLLFRWRMGELKMDIVGIASNHRDLEPLAAQHGLPFHHLPVTADTKPQQEARLLDLFESSGAESCGRPSGVGASGHRRSGAGIGRRRGHYQPQLPHQSQLRRLPWTCPNGCCPSSTTPLSAFGHRS